MPEVGSRRNPTAKTEISVSATQKFGALAPASDSTEMIRSTTPVGRTEAHTPSTIAPAVANSIVQPASARLVG